MTAAWIAGNVRARALLNRRLGAAKARELAASPSVAAAVRLLAESPYQHDVRSGDTLAEAQRGLRACLLWHLRVLAGWQPRAGIQALRLLAGWFEAGNIGEHARALAGYPAAPPYRLGALATAWPRLVTTTSLPQLRDALADSPWGDPGGETPAVIAIGTQLAWAHRVSTDLAVAETAAVSGAAVVVARHRFLDDGSLTHAMAERAEFLLGAAAVAAPELSGFATALAPRARWVLADIDTPAELWRAEARWWARIEHDGFALLRPAAFGLPRVVGTAAVLAADARRCEAALETAARGGDRLEAFDAVA